jgi:hypothetical protein
MPPSIGTRTISQGENRFSSGQGRLKTAASIRLWAEERTACKPASSLGKRLTP